MFYLCLLVYIDILLVCHVGQMNAKPKRYWWSARLIQWGRPRTLEPLEGTTGLEGYLTLLIIADWSWNIMWPSWPVVPCSHSRVISLPIWSRYWGRYMPNKPMLKWMVLAKTIAQVSNLSRRALGTEESCWLSLIPGSERAKIVLYNIVSSIDTNVQTNDIFLTNCQTTRNFCEL